MRVLFAGLTALALLPACEPEGCIADVDGCVVPSPCTEVSFECPTSAPATVRVATSDDAVPTSLAALVAPGDLVLDNGIVTAVIEALDHPHYLGPTGGNLVDLSNSGRDDDVLRQILAVTGLLPGDAAHYTSLEVLDTTDGSVAVQAKGYLEGYPDIRIATRYELRPCDPGVRVRTELVNDSPDTRTLALMDGWYWGSRELLAFAPYAGAGFAHPSFGLSTVGDAIAPTPYIAAAGRAAPASSYGEASCDHDDLAGFHSESISAVGPERRLVKPGDFLTWERFISVGAGAGASVAIDPLLELRRQLWDEPWVWLSGTVDVEGGDSTDLGRDSRAQLVIREGLRSDDPATTIPWTHAVPAADGTFRVAVPASRDYVIDAVAFGQVVGSMQVAVGADDTSAGTLTFPAAGALELNATVQGEPDLLLAFLTPSDAADVDALSGQFLGHFEVCAPLLGNPHAESPACNRILVDGSTTVLVPPGTYDVRAVAGPFSTLAEVQRVVVTAGERTEVELAVDLLPLAPEGTLSGDFHVHGGSSFDSGFDPVTRVKSFVAANLDVVATTEHDTIYDYAGVAAELGVTDRVVVLDGTESTGHILFSLFDDAAFPKVFGHWNLWPIPYDGHASLRGAPWDEMALPAELIDRAVARGFNPATGVVQLNHPWGGAEFGRDYGWAEAIELDLTKDLPPTYDGSGSSLFLHRPAGSAFANSDYQVQEVMNGSANKVVQGYRAVWHYLLNQGVVRGGTANSDTHSLTENVTGLPRNLVWTDTTRGAFSADTFHAAVRDGRMIGTNGPVLEVSTTDAQGGTRRPSLTSFTAGSGATLQVRVSAAPWVPVDEVRVIVNGEVVHTWTDLDDPADDFDTDALLRLDASIPLADLLPAGGDAWIVVEAGAPLVPSADLDCNGVPDTSDNNGDGRIDWKDVTELAEDPEAECLDSTGPLSEPPLPERGARGYAYSVVVPDGYPMSFTNPLLIDPNGDGFKGVAR